MEDADLADDDLLSNKVEINLHMFDALMLNGVGREVDDTDVIIVDQRALRQRTLELMEQLSQPSGLSHTIGDSTVLNLRAETGDDSLSFGQPGHQIGPQEDHVAGSGATCVRTPRPVSVCIASEIGAGRATQEKAVHRSPLKVAQNALYSRQVGLPGLCICRQICCTT
jgi:hypothetical protein